MKFRAIFSITAVFIFCITSCQYLKAQKLPNAVRGVLDLRNSFGISISKTESFSLDGEWEFYWKELIEPPFPKNLILPNSKNISETKNLNLLTPNYTQVPGSWEKIKLEGKQIENHGYATYRLRVLLPENFPKTETLCLKTENIGSAYKLFINGKLVSTSGKIGKSREDSEPEMRFRWIPFGLDSQNPNELEIIFQVSDFYDRSGGLWTPLLLGFESDFVNRAKQKFVLDLIVFSALFMIGFYHLGLYWYRKKDLSAFYFAFYCILISARVIFTSERMVLDAFPFLSFLIVHKIEYISFYLGAYIFFRFIATLYPEEFSERISKVFRFLLIPASLLVVLFPLNIYIKTLTLVQFVALFGILYTIKTLYSATLNKKLGAKLLLFAFLIIASAVINDILRAMEFINTPQLSSYGLLVFVFFQSLLLSRRFAVGFEQAEKLTEDLELKTIHLEEASLELSMLAQSLEIKIEERTKDLEETKKELEELNQFTYIINSLSNLDHIFSEISAYIYHKFGIVGIWLLLPDKGNKYLNAFKAYSYDKLPREQYEYLLEKKIPMKEKEGGMVYKTFNRKKPFYLVKIPKHLSGVDKEIVETLNLDSLLLIPLIRQNVSIGVFAFSNIQKEMKLSSKQIQKLSSLCFQITGAVYTNHLLQQVEKSKRQTTELNSLIKVLNELSDLESIFSKLSLYIFGRYHFPYYSLAIIDKKENVLKNKHSYIPEEVSQEQVLFLKKMKISLDGKEQNSIHVKAFQLKKPIYIPDAPSSIQTDSGKLILSILNHKSFVTIPLILQNQPIAMLDLMSQETVFLTEEDLVELSILGEQLAGIIHGSILIQQIQEEKERVELQNLEIQKLAESRKRLSVVGQMVAGIVHDIKNPITTIKALSERLGLSTLSPQKREQNTNLIQKEMDRLNDLVYEILDFSKGTLVLDLKLVNLQNFLLELGTFLKTDFEYASVEFRLDLNYVGDLVFDSGRLRRVLVNLIKNAIEAMYDGSRDYYVKVSTNLQKENLVITVEDNGPGLPDSFEAKIFEAFATEGKAKGTGLGLFMSKWIVEAHNGVLTYKSIRNTGTSFYITIPMNLKENTE